MSVRSFLSSAVCQLQCVRLTSTKTLRPHPRPYQRRLWDKVLQPVVPVERLSMPQKCKHRKSAHELYIMENHGPSDMDVGLSKHIATRVMPQFRVMAICHHTPLNYRGRKLEINAMRMEGIEVKGYNNTAMRLVIEHTALAALGPLITARTMQMFAKYPTDIKTIVNWCKRSKFLVLLACVIDHKILSIKECEELALLPSLDILPAQTVGLLRGVPSDTCSIINAHSHQLVNNLEAIVARGDTRN